jgi:hypothetical protein
VLEPPGARRERVYVEDLRRDGSFLRVTWHPERETFVVTHWRDQVCIAANQISIEAAPPLISLLVASLAASAANHARAAASVPPTSPPGPGARIGRAFDRWWVRVRPPRHEPPAPPTAVERRTA